MSKNVKDNEVKTIGNKNHTFTPCGFLFRKYKVDEFFQLINVICGDMNLIGPRPVPFVEFNLYNENEKKVSLITPGLSDFSSLFLSDLNVKLSEHEQSISDFDFFLKVYRPIKSRLALFLHKTSIYLG